MQQTFSYIYSLPYISLFIIFFLLFLWENKLRKNNRNIDIIRYICMLVFFLFFGFRGYIDTDFAVYYPIYEMTPTLNDVDGTARFFSSINEDYIVKIEPGFKVALVILKSISNNYFFLQIVSSLINVLFLNYFFKRFSPQYALGFVIFLIFSGLIIEINLIRNSKAIFLFIYSLQYIKERKALQFYLCNTIGILFHSSAFFYFPLYFFLHKKFPPFLIWSCFIVGNVLYLGQIKYITPIITTVGSFFGGTYSLLAEAYSTSNLYNSGYGITVGYLEKVFSFILFYKSYRRIGEIVKDEKLLNIFYNLFYVSFFTYLFLSEYTVLIDRMTTLFVFSYWILYPYFYEAIQKIFKTIFVMILFLFGILKMYKSNNFITRNYSNILLGKPSLTNAYYILNKHIDKILNPK